MELRISNLSKRYANGVHALKDVTLTIPAGMFGLLGPNGAGKSTLMRTLATLQEADSGTVTLEGVGDGVGAAGGLDVLRDKDGVRRALGYLPQEFGLYPKVNAIDLLDHFAVLKGIGSASQRREVVSALLKKTNLWDARFRKLGTFSGGMKQRFGIAQALLGDPKLIIVDEPTAGLDPEERNRFHNLLAEIGENVVVILSTHIVDDVSDLCPRMAVLHQGQVVLTGAPLELVERMRGRVWKKFVDKPELETMLSTHQVLSTRRVSGRILARVHAPGLPANGFEPAEPDLEDAYFFAIRGYADPSVTAVRKAS